MVIVDDMRVVRQFEEEVSKYANSKYGIAVSSNTDGILLCLELLKLTERIKEGDIIEIPKQTFISVPMSILNAKCKIKFRDEKWSGAYRLIPTSIWDSAVRFTKGMYIEESLYVVSFQYKKLLPIGKGGMILTNSKEDADVLRKLRFNGRTEGINPSEDNYDIKGFNAYFLPEQAARGLTLMSLLPEKNKDIGSWQDYPDVSKQIRF